jgi:hypothetical protein
MRYRLLTVVKVGLTVAAGAVVVMMIAAEVAVAIVAIQFFTIFAGY